MQKYLKEIRMNLIGDSGHTIYRLGEEDVRMIKFDCGNILVVQKKYSHFFPSTSIKYMAFLEDV